MERISKIIKWDKKLCKLCGLCISICPKKGLSITDHKMSHNETACIKCGLCEKICPDIAIEVIK